MIFTRILTDPFVIRGLITLEEGLTAEGLLPDLSVLPGAHGGRRLINHWAI